MEKFDPTVPLRYGIIALTTAVTIVLLSYVFFATLAGNIMMFAAIGIISLALVLFLAIWSGITYRRANGGLISFSHAFLAVFLIFVFNVFGSSGTQLLVNKVIDTHYAARASSLMKEKMTEQFEKRNMDEDKIKEATTQISPENFDPPLDKVLQSALINLGFFGIVSAIVAAFIKRGSGDLISSGIAPEPIKTI